MDRTALARTLLEPIPAHRTAEIATRTPPELTNVMGSLHSSGLVALLDATGLGAIIAASTVRRTAHGPPGTGGRRGCRRRHR
ncbi:hypothetical protein ACFZAE_31585 [Streptomyces scabiei]|uniref:hypothetical protein n=1 Tax=Streptomyces scabiei TaxID=1930 RepID=UPI0036EA06E9